MRTDANVSRFVKKDAPFSSSFFLLLFLIASKLFRRETATNYTDDENGGWKKEHVFLLFAFVSLSS